MYFEKIDLRRKAKMYKALSEENGKHMNKSLKY